MKHILVPKIDLSSVKNYNTIDLIDTDFAILDNINNIPLFDYPSIIETTVFALCLKGNCKITINLNEYNICPNDMILLMPNQIVMLCEKSDDVSGLFIVVSKNFSNEILPSTEDMLSVFFYAKDNGKTVYEMLQDIYLTYGFSKEKGISVVRKGKSGAEEIEAMMKNFRNNPMTEIAGSKVILTKDFSTLVANDLVENEKYTLDMPTTSNVLQYFTEDGTKVSIRPSGTEPKIKFYIEVKGELKSREDYDKVNELANQKIEAVKVSLGI